ncbi:MAG TPA: cyclic nucleotide-binding domain-containing protein [Bryobacteraceae bacterium]|jgi:hypothetical protein
MHAESGVALFSSRHARRAGHAHNCCRTTGAIAGCGRSRTFTLDPAHDHAEISFERLRLVGAFYGMSDALLAEARTLLRTKEYPAGHVVSRQGEYGASVYIILRGSVELLMEKSAGDVRCVGV